MASADKIDSQALNLGNAWDRDRMEYFAGVVILIILLIWRVKRSARNLQKMCWIFFQHYIHLGDEKAKRGFQHIYVVFADEMKNEFREMVDLQMIGFQSLLEARPNDEISSDQKIQHFALKVRLRDCQDFVQKNLSTTLSEVRETYRQTADVYPDLAKAIKRSDLAFAKHNLPADFHTTDYHKFLDELKRPTT